MNKHLIHFLILFLSISSGIFAQKKISILGDSLSLWNNQYPSSRYRKTMGTSFCKRNEKYQ